MKIWKNASDFHGEKNSNSMVLLLDGLKGWQIIRHASLQAASTYFYMRLQRFFRCSKEFAGSVVASLDYVSCLDAFSSSFVPFSIHSISLNCNKKIDSCSSEKGPVSGAKLADYLLLLNKLLARQKITAQYRCSSKRMIGNIWFGSFF